MLPRPICNSSRCAVGMEFYYPEFYVKKSVQIANQVDCYCAHLEASQKIAWARFALTPAMLEELAATSWTCLAASCADTKAGTKLGSNDYCVFKEKAKVIPKECTAAQKMLCTAMCKADDRFTGEAVFQ